MSDKTPPPTARIADCDDGAGAPPGAEATEPREAAQRPDALYVASDGNGYIGAFPSAAAAEAAMQPHPLVPYIIQRFAVAPGPIDSVWVVLYRDLDAVAFVSNDREEAARIQQVYAGVGLAYPDEIDYWEQPFGAVAKSAAERLDIQTRAYQSWAGATEADFRAAEEADLARAEALCAPRADGPLARAFRENERTTILDAVVPWSPGAEKRKDEAPDCDPCAAGLDYGSYGSYGASLAVDPRARDDHTRWVEGSARGPEGLAGGPPAGAPRAEAGHPEDELCGSCSAAVLREEPGAGQ